MPPHLLNYFEIKEYYQKEPKFNVVYSRNISPKINDGAYVINFEELTSIGMYWIALYVNGNNRRASYNAIYFDSFGAEYIPKETKKLRENKSIITNIYRIQAYSTALKCRSFSEKSSKNSTCAVMIRIIITFANQIFLQLI